MGLIKWKNYSIYDYMRKSCKKYFKSKKLLTNPKIYMLTSQEPGTPYSDI